MKKLFSIGSNLFGSTGHKGSETFSSDDPNMIAISVGAGSLLGYFLVFFCVYKRKVCNEENVEIDYRFVIMRKGKDCKPKKQRVKISI